MKNAKLNQGTPDRRAVKNRNAPDIRDNMDSRERQEQMVKGDDITHNVKETKAQHLKSKKK